MNPAVPTPATSRGEISAAGDYLFLAPLLRERLSQSLPDVPCDVCETADQVLAADQRAQVMMVLYAGDRVDAGPGGSARGGASQTIHQRWLAMLGLNNVGVAKAARQLRAGPMLLRMHQALSGWQPAGCNRPMRRVTTPLQPTFTTSKAVYPLGFEITLTL